jgi:hypothetical protein
MPPGDNFDTIIQHVSGGYPEPEAGPVRPDHRVLRFLAGTGLFLLDAILLKLFVLVLHFHG